LGRWLTPKTRAGRVLTLARGRPQQRVGVIVDAPGGPVQTAAFEIEGDVIRALYVVRNPDKLRHLATTVFEPAP